MGHDRIFPVYICIYEFCFYSPIFNGTIYSHDGIAISHDILYASHFYGIVILGICQPMDSKNFYYYFMTALVFCWYWLYCVTQIPSLSFKISETSNIHTIIIEDVRQAIKDFEIQTNAKFSVYLTQGNFCS